jgi:hypothetical protein
MKAKIIKHLQIEALVLEIFQPKSIYSPKFVLIATQEQKFNTKVKSKKRNLFS